MTTIVVVDKVTPEFIQQISANDAARAAAINALPTDAETLTNKTINGTNNTLTNLPAGELVGDGAAGAESVNLTYAPADLAAFKALTSRPLIVVFDGNNWTWVDGDATPANGTATAPGTSTLPPGDPKHSRHIIAAA